MKIWKLTIEDAKGKAKGQFFTTITAPNGEKTHISETIKMKGNAINTLLRLVNAILNDKFKFVDNTAQGKIIEKLEKTVKSKSFQKKLDRKTVVDNTTPKKK